MISLSSEVQREFREYERFSTAVLNAYLQPVMGRYLSYLEERLASEAATAKVGIYQSSGGLMSIDTARRFPVRTALSGPAAGAVGGIHSARAVEAAQHHHARHGRHQRGCRPHPRLRGRHDLRPRGRWISDSPADARYPHRSARAAARSPGSIATACSRSARRAPAPIPAPPAMAEAERARPSPTPISCSAGFPPKGLIGGRMPLDPEAARAAIAPIAERLDFSIERTALGIIEIVVANMVRAIRTVSVERGHDPRNYCLLPFGGAGPLHASEVARALGISPLPGAGRARHPVRAGPDRLGSEGRHRSLGAHQARAAKPCRRSAAILASLMQDADAWFAREAVKPADRRVNVVLRHALCRTEFRAAGAGRSCRWRQVARAQRRGEIANALLRRARSVLRLPQRSRPDRDHQCPADCERATCQAERSRRKSKARGHAPQARRITGRSGFRMPAGEARRSMTAPICGRAIPSPARPSSSSSIRPRVLYPSDRLIVGRRHQSPRHGRDNEDGAKRQSIRSRSRSSRMVCAPSPTRPSSR